MSQEFTAHSYHYNVRQYKSQTSPFLLAQILIMSMFSAKDHCTFIIHHIDFFIFSISHMVF